MLVQFRFSNFRSFREEADLSFVAATNLRHRANHGVNRPEGSKRVLVNVAGLFGANASGKSNVVKALRFVREAVADSQRSWEPDGPIPVEPFLLDTASVGQPSRFQLDLIVDRVPMQYGFALTRKEVHEEWLLAWPGGRQQRLFERSGPASFSFGRGLKGPNDTIAKLTRKNSLFLSAAAQNNHEQLRPLYSRIIRQILPLSPEDEVSRRDFTMSRVHQGQREAITNLVQLADLGIVDVVVEEQKIPMTPEVRAQALKILQERGAPSAVSKYLPETDMVVPHLTFAHTSEHAPGGVIFEETGESRGTLAWFALAGPILKALEEGSVLVADELDTSLHELLQAMVIRIFNSPKCNPRGAQLLFSSQDTTVLGDALPLDQEEGGSLLRRDQIWFTEKDRDGASKLVPLTDFHVRQKENIQRWYLRGRFGAVPILDERLIPCADSEDQIPEVCEKAEGA